MSARPRKIASKTIGVRKAEIKYVERRAVRVIITNDQNQISIIHAKKDNYYKLPGGGVEAGEDHMLAVKREAMEETGCEITTDATEHIAEVEEWRNDLHQISYCYTATLLKDTGAVDLSDDEVLDGLQHEWISIDGALKKMKSVEPTTELGKFIKERDTFFVEKYAQQGSEECSQLEKSMDY